MNIPDRAIELLDELLEVTKHVKGSVQDWMELGEDPLFGTFFYDSVDYLLQHISLFGYSWFNIDPLDCSAELSEIEGKYFYTFCHQGRSDNQESKSLEIPADLGKCLFRIINATGYGVSRWYGLCDQSCRSLFDFREKLRIHMEMRQPKKPKAIESVGEPAEVERRDYEEHRYLCRDKIHIPGELSDKRSNIISLNQKNVEVSNSLFALFIRLVQELKKNKGGWVNVYALEHEKIIADPARYQVYGRLRTELKGALLDGDSKKFIQNDGAKNYRISVHPDFVTYDREKLLRHPDRRIIDIALKLS